jgi:ubiquinone/menaquinone biosynthesis C-methylase UbiE
MAKKVCPHWVGYLLASPVRRLFQNPEKILRPYVEDGMAAVDIGCAMGFFSLPLARMVGEKGKVVCVDVQEKMLQSLRKRARKAGLAERIIIHLCPQDSLSLNAFERQIDFALAFAVIHEVPDAFNFFCEVSRAVKSG